METVTIKLYTPRSPDVLPSNPSTLMPAVSPSDRERPPFASSAASTVVVPPELPPDWGAKKDGRQTLPANGSNAMHETPRGFETQWGEDTDGTEKAPPFIVRR